MIIGLVIVAGVLLVTTILLLVVAQRSVPSNTTSTDVGNSTSIDTSNSPVSDATTITSDTADTTANTTVVIDSKTKLYQIVRFFTERYGSYSTDNEHENIDSLRPFMTDTMQTTADALITTQTNTASNDAVYYGVTTQAANVNIIDYAPAATGATVEVVTRRVETTAGTTKTYTQTARLQLKTINNAWKVDTFKWQKL